MSRSVVEFFIIVMRVGGDFGPDRYSVAGSVTLFCLERPLSKVLSPLHLDWITPIRKTRRGRTDLITTLQTLLRRLNGASSVKLFLLM